MKIKNIVSLFHNKRILFLSLIFITCIGFHFSLFVKAAGDGKFFLLNEDEVIYYCSAKLFSATNSLQAESCIDEDVSKVGSMNWYGPGYNVIFGSVFKIVGSHPAVFPWMNFMLALSMLGLVFLLPVTLEIRLLAATALSVTHHFCVYIYTYFPETLVLFLATILTVLLVLYYSAKDEKSRKIYLIAFVTCTIIFMLCRITFIFWIAGLIAFAENRKDLKIRMVFFLVCVIISLVYMKLFTAPPYTGYMHKIGLLYTGNFLGFISMTIEAFFVSVKMVINDNSYTVTLLLLFVGVSMIVYFFNKSRLVLASILISLCLLGVMFAFYSVHEFYLTKQTAMLVPLIIVTLAVTINMTAVKYGFVLILMLVSTRVYKRTNELIATGRSGYEHYTNSIALEKSFEEIPQYIEDKKTLILWCYREYDYGYSAQALLPFSTRAKYPIMYTTNITDPNAVPEDKFKRHNKLKVDYILSRHAISWSNLEQVHKTEFYYLYKLLD